MVAKRVMPGHMLPWLVQEAGGEAMDARQIELMRQALERRIAEGTSSREAALAMLIRDGVATPDGQLTPEFGGPGAEE